jgi:hypothetical protein
VGGNILENLIENSKKIAFIIFFSAGLLAVLLYSFPRYEYDEKSSEVTIGFEKSYNAEISPFYSVRNIDEIGLSGDRVIYILDFDKLKGDFEFYSELIKRRNGKKIIFIGNPPDILSVEFGSLLDKNRIKVGFLELNQVTSWMRECLQQMSEEIRQGLFRVHTVKPAEIDKLNLDYPMVIKRWLRASRERSIDFFWIQPLDPGIKAYEVYGTELSQTIGFKEELETIIPKKYGALKIIFIIGCFAVIYAYSPLFFIITLALFVFFIYSSSMTNAYLYLAGFAGMFGSAAIYRLARDFEDSVVLKFIALISLSILLGNLINAVSFTFDSVNQVYLPHGVKLTLFYLPFLVFLKEFAEYGYKDLTTRLHWSDLLFLLFIVLFGVYYIVRSGNSGWVLSTERQFRDWIEGIFQVRPRFKEIVGIPALWLYISGVHRKFGRYSFLIPVLGSIGLCSIVNSFQHVHTPIETILLRETIGVMLGTVIGVIIWYIVKKINVDDEM